MGYNTSFNKRKNLIFVFLLVLMTANKAMSSVKVSNSTLPVPYFSGRNEELKSIERNLSNIGSVVSLTGFTGIGKTQIIRQYLSKNLDNYKIIWVFDCNLDLSYQFLNLAKQINLKICNKSSTCIISEDIQHISESVMNYLRHETGWILVFDNLRTNENNKVLRFLEDSHNGHIVVCSQETTGLPNIIPIKNLKRIEALGLIEKLLPNYKLRDVEKLSEIFLDYPILIIRGTLFLQNNRYLSIEEYKKILAVSDEVKRTKEQLGTIFDNLSSAANNLLLKVALINNHDFSKQLLINLSGSDSSKVIDILHDLSKFALIEDKGIYKENQIFEVHDFIKKTVLESASNKVIRDSMQDIVKTINQGFPEKITDYLSLFHKDPTLQSNLEIMLENAEKNAVNFYDILELRKNLMFFYLTKRDYDKCKKFVEWLIDKETRGEIKYHDMSNNQKVAYAWYLVNVGLYKTYSARDIKNAEYDYEKAAETVRNVDGFADLKCAIYSQLTQSRIRKGAINDAKLSIKKVEQFIKEDQDIFYKGLLWYSYARIFLAEGEYNLALENANKLVKSQENLPQDQFTILGHILKVEILIKLGDYEAAYILAKELDNRSKSYFDEPHEMQARILTWLALAELNVDKIKNAEEHISLAKKIFLALPERKKDNISDSSDYDLAAALIVEGDIYHRQNKIAEALQAYKIAENIYHNCYGQNMLLDHISDLYFKIANSALIDNNIGIYKEYLSKHENIFGVDHFRTKAMYQSFLKNN